MQNYGTRSGVSLPNHVLKHEPKKYKTGQRGIQVYQALYSWMLNYFTYKDVLCEICHIFQFSKQHAVSLTFLAGLSPALDGFLALPAISQPLHECIQRLCFELALPSPNATTISVDHDNIKIEK